ncbi:FAD-dependent monooxygenase [Amycolatopsis sp. H20-H5]|uniref:FAD-dependent monooxygenase n=1 Tax=Amycolatopsis sp. H20-H5 TaxID=3046309 RepID=UPI002DBDB317|nr:FAD-dependent monooxygenase [Amycolatopsis sp. H20-H5]MEC3975871.1 FAD-dependent monooxygenase [Amycolatopsis sp. H20-H5]
MPEDLPNDRLRLWRGDGLNILTLPLRGGADLAIDSVIFQDTPPDDLWNSEIATEDLVGNFAHFDPRIIRAIRGGTVPVRANPVYDRAPTPRWSTDRVTLLGDAAHPMAPMLGQGANQAKQDAAALATDLAQAPDADIPAALRRYQDLRAPITAKFYNLRCL